MPSKLAAYWDACVFIDRMQRRADRIKLLEELTNCAQDGAFMIVTSTITIAEVIKIPELGLATQEEARLIADYFEHEWISVRPVTTAIAHKAADVRRQHGLKTADAIHVATALLTEGVVMLHTYDGDDLLKRDGKIGNPSLRITPPCLVGAGELFSLQPSPSEPPATQP